MFCQFLKVQVAVLEVDEGLLHVVWTGRYGLFEEMFECDVQDFVSVLCFEFLA